MTDWKLPKWKGLDVAEKAMKSAERAAARTTKQLNLVTVQLDDARDRAKQARSQTALGGPGKRARSKRALKRVKELRERLAHARRSRDDARDVLRLRRGKLSEETKRAAQRTRAIEKMLMNWDKSAIVRGDQMAQLISAEQLRAARAVLEMSRKEFAFWLTLPLTRIRRFEQSAGAIHLDKQTANHVRKVLRSGGIELISRGFYLGSGGAGIRIRASGVRVPIAQTPGASGLGAATKKKRRKARVT